MPQVNRHSTPDEDADRLIRLADALGLEIAPEELEALSKQLRLLDALERDELQDYAPVLTMDADWYD